MPDWLGIPAAFIAWSFALYVFLVAPKTLAARLLIALLVVDGIAVISSYGNSYVIDPSIGLGELRWWQIHQASDWLVITFYLAFIGVTVRSPLTRPLRPPAVRWALLIIGSVLAASIFFQDKTELIAMMPALYPAIVLALTWGFVSAIHAWVIAKDEASRARAQRFSDAAMPNTQATPEYTSYRKLQVYESALHTALENGNISGRERQVLNSLIQSMGIDPQAAQALERDALAGS